MTVDTVCILKILDARTSVRIFTSPNYYGGGYRPNGHYCWSIKGKTGYRLSIKFKVFNLKYSKNCSRDYVSIYEYNSNYPKRFLRKRLCGRHFGYSFIVTNNVWIELKTDYQRSYYTGFITSYVLVKDHDNKSIGSTVAAVAAIVGTIAGIIFLGTIVGGAACCIIFCKKRTVSSRAVNPVIVNTNSTGVNIPVTTLTTSISNIPLQPLQNSLPFNYNVPSLSAFGGPPPSYDEIYKS